MHVSVFLDGQPVFICPADPDGGDWVWYDPDGQSRVTLELAETTSGQQITETNTGSFPVNDRTDAAGRGPFLGIAG